MGHEPREISKTYGHLLPDDLDRTRTALDMFLAAPVVEAERAEEARVSTGKPLRWARM